jgi:CheY-like chemotaxis protein
MGSQLPLRVLVVDNDESASAATSGSLESLGHRADAETDGPGALRVFSENADEFDLAITGPNAFALTAGLGDLTSPEDASGGKKCRSIELLTTRMSETGGGVGRDGGPQGKDLRAGKAII